MAKRSRSRRRRAVRPIRTARQADALTLEQQETWHRSLEVLRLMRSEGLSFTAAAAEAGVSRASALRYVKPALGKGTTGRYRARKDRLLRQISLPTPQGTVWLDVIDSETASEIGRYKAALRQFLPHQRRGSLMLTSDPDALQPFRGVSVRTQHGKFPLLTDSRTLRRLAAQGELRLDEYYRQAR